MSNLAPTMDMDPLLQPGWVYSQFLPSDLFNQFLEEGYSGNVLNCGVIGLYDA